MKILRRLGGWTLATELSPLLGQEYNPAEPDNVGKQDTQLEGREIDSEFPSFVNYIDKFTMGGTTVKLISVNSDRYFQLAVRTGMYSLIKFLTASS